MLTQCSLPGATSRAGGCGHGDGGEATYDHSLKSLRPGGRLVISGATSGPNPPADLARIFFKQLSVVGSTMGTRDGITRSHPALREQRGAATHRSDSADVGGTAALEIVADSKSSQIVLTHG